MICRKKMYNEEREMVSEMNKWMACGGKNKARIKRKR